MESIQKIVSLIKKTGDKAIVLDQNGDPSYVVMTVADYERLVLGKSQLQGLTEDELLDKINRDIEVWKDSQENDNLPIGEHDFSQELGKNSDIEMDSGFNEIPTPDNMNGFSPNLVDSDELEEDRYYFEPVE